MTVCVRACVDSCLHELIHRHLTDPTDKQLHADVSTALLSVGDEYNGKTSYLVPPTCTSSDRSAAALKSIQHCTFPLYWIPTHFVF